MGEAKRRNQSRDADFVQLTAMFQSHGVNTTEFSFYDQPSFLEQEKTQPEYLEHYARWVMLRPVNHCYRSHVRSIVPRLAELISTSLIEDQWEGSCVAASGLISRMLDRLSVWSFGLVGSATFSIQKPPIWRGLHSVDYQDFPDVALGHFWVCAPPYFIVDASAALQRWGDDPIRQFIPQTILDDTGVHTKPRADDVVSARIRTKYALHEGREDHNLHYRLERPGGPTGTPPIDYRDNLRRAAQGGHLWTPPLMQAFLRTARACGQVRSSVRPHNAAGLAPRARMEMRGPGPRSILRA